MFKIYTINEAKEWDEKVVSFSNHDIYYLSGYLKSFEIHGDGYPVLVYYESDGLRGMCAFMLRDIADEKWAKSIDKGQFFDAVTPYGYGGWLMDGDCSDEKLKRFWKEYEIFMKGQKIVCAFTRWCPWLKNQDVMRGLSSIIDLGNTIFIDTTTVDGIMENIKSKDRSTIRKAVKNGITVKLSDDPALFKEFIEIYNGTMLKDNAEEYYFFNSEFYQSIIDDLKGNWLMATAKLEDKIIAMSIMLFFNGHVHYHLSGSIFEYRSLNATSLILYATAMYGAEHGYKLFHLGGGVGSSEDPLYKFKKSFNKNGDLLFSISKDMFDLQTYNMLVEIRKKNDAKFVQSGFFPGYRSVED